MTQPERAGSGGDSVSLAAGASLALGLATLVGLHGLGPFHLNPLLAFLWGAIGTSAAVADLRRRDEDTRAFPAQVGLALSILATLASALVLVAIAPCGTDCL